MPKKKSSSKPKASSSRAPNGDTSDGVSPAAGPSKLPTPPRSPEPAQKRPRREDSTSTSPAGDSDAADEVPVAHLGYFNVVSPGYIIPDSPVAVEKEPTAAELKDRGNVEFKKGKYDDAVGWYSKAIAADPTEPTYLTNRSAAYIALRRFAPALADCQRANSLQSSSPSPKTLLRLAKCQLALGDTAAALSSVSQVLSLAPGEKGAREMQGKIARVEQHLKRFEEAKLRGEGTLARISLQEAERESDGFGEGTRWRCWRVEALVAAGAGKLDDASGAVGDAARVDRESPEVLYLRGLVLFLQGQLGKAVNHCVEVLRLDPDHSRARTLMRRAKAVEAKKEEGNAAFKSGRLQEAVTRYGEALELVGQKPEEAKGGVIRAVLLSNRATANVKLNRLDDALADVSLSLSLQPGSYKAMRTRARILLAQESYEDAVREFAAALEQAKQEGASDVRALAEEQRKAEVALKRSKTKDHYKTLGIGKSADEGEIKKAYRKLSLIHHPDKGGDEEQFKVIQEAHSVLSDPERKRRYDLGEDDDMGGMGGHGGGGMQGMDPEDIAHIFQFMGGGMGGMGGGMGGMPGGGRRGRGGPYANQGFSF